MFRSRVARLAGAALFASSLLMPAAMARPVSAETPSGTVSQETFSRLEAIWDSLERSVERLQSLLAPRVTARQESIEVMKIEEGCGIDPHGACGPH